MTVFKKTPLRHIFTFACMVLVAAMLFSSCSDDNEQTPEVEPDPETSITDVKIAGIAANARVWDKITLTLDAASEAGIEKFEIKVDGKVVATLTSAPFQFELNTKNLSDGAHILSVTATNKEGGQKTAEMPFTVQNALARIYVPEDFLQNGARGFIFLSDSLGKTIVAQEYFAGDSLVLEEPAYTQSTFTLTQGYIDANEFHYLYSYRNVPRGRWALIAREDDRDQAKREVDLTLTNVDEDGQYEFSSAGEKSWYYNTGDTYTVEYNGNDSQLFIGYTPGDTEGPMTHYLYFPSILAQHAAIDLATAKPMMKKQFDISAFDGAAYYLWAMSGEYSYQLDEVEGISSTLEYHYPADAFSKYVVLTYLAKGGKNFRNLTEGEPSIATINADIQATFEDNTFTGTTTGLVDYCTYALNGDHVYWQTYAPAGGQPIKLPEIPALFANLFVDDFANAFIEVAACDAINFDGYDTFIRTFTEFSGDAIRDNFGYALSRQVYKEVKGKNTRRSARARSRQGAAVARSFTW